MGMVPNLGRSHMLQSNKAHLPQLLSLCSRAWDLQLLSPYAETTEACKPRACYNKRSHYSLQLEKAHLQQWKPRATNNKYIKKKYSRHPWWLMVKNLPAIVGDTDSIPDWEDPTYHGATKPICRNYWACALEPGRHSCWSPLSLEPVLCNKKSHHHVKPTLQT